jgi:hypothetical protein
MLCSLLLILQVLSVIMLFASFLIPTIILCVLLSKVQHLPLDIAVQKDEVSELCFWALGCTGFMILLTIVRYVI